MVKWKRIRRIQCRAEALPGSVPRSRSTQGLALPVNRNRLSTFNYCLSIPRDWIKILSQELISIEVRWMMLACVGYVRGKGWETSLKITLRFALSLSHMRIHYGGGLLLDFATLVDGHQIGPCAEEVTTPMLLVFEGHLNKFSPSQTIEYQNKQCLKGAKLALTCSSMCLEAGLASSEPEVFLMELKTLMCIEILESAYLTEIKC